MKEYKGKSKRKRLWDMKQAVKEYKGESKRKRLWEMKQATRARAKERGCGT